jgi:putative colanic acid biosynthesis acetyltransferase WcaF
LREALDIAGNRSGRKYQPSEQLLRFLWWFIYAFLFRMSPRLFWNWRVLLLRLFGAKVGSHARISNTARIWMPWKFSIGDWSALGEEVWIYNLGNVTIGSQVTLSQKAHLCAGSHDYEDPSMPLLKKSIRICDRAWVCADAFIGPGVTIGEGAVVGAGSVVPKDVPPWTVVSGNPARFIKKRVIKKGEGLV